jgi:hypothetical protein
MDEAGAQRFLAPEPVVHRRSAEAKAQRCSGLFAAGRKYFPDDSPPLPEIKELH